VKCLRGQKYVVIDDAPFLGVPKAAQRVVAAFKNSTVVRRLVARYKTANQPSGARQEARKNTNPINKPKGISKEIVKENGTMRVEGDDNVRPQSRDILPKDVFTPTPDHTGVLNLAQSGKDLSKSINKQVPKDKGYDVVRNLSQYLIRTKGTGEEGTEEGR
jgi:hypothetical protein